MNHNQDTIWDLDLPEIEEIKKPNEAPSYEAQTAHAQFLLLAKEASFFDERIKRVNPEAFRWIE